ncbi:MAG: hypothetical protein O3C66_00660 [Proteobacteria bacterium]|jgi:succinate dehydrogenase hydrophobic anchor subunit|nr:hypothetical protein [Pseudomonadota bacterium]MDA0880469.1 hypothetical protein [Pseudomonadota bacterium]|tara:strand:- start:2171 stop:2521 length:351 start_codon:yes stop_codon:yes gene_type:complete
MNIGKFFWYLQRYSALYFLFFLGYLEYLYWSDQLAFDLVTSNLALKVSLSLFIILACMHGFVGLWTVGTDYFTKRTLGFISPRLGSYGDLIRKIYEGFFVLLGIVIVILYLLIIWS